MSVTLYRRSYLVTVQDSTLLSGEHSLRRHSPSSPSNAAALRPHPEHFSSFSLRYPDSPSSSPARRLVICRPLADRGGVRNPPFRTNYYGDLRRSRVVEWSSRFRQFNCC